MYGDLKDLSITNSLKLPQLGRHQIRVQTVPASLINETFSCQHCQLCLDKGKLECKEKFCDGEPSCD